MMNSSMPV
ncbi:ACD_00320 [African swine fever virus]